MQNTTQSEEQQVYSLLLLKSVKISLNILFLAFTAYFISLLTAYISYDRFVNNWNLPVHEYHSAVGLVVEGGWGWVGQLSYPDLASLITVMYLSSITIICYLKIIPLFLKKKDRVYLALAAVEVCVLLIAASGILRVGGH